MLTGLEIRTDPEDYYWHGRKRRNLNPFRQSTNPCGQGMTSYLVWQYTLSGWGMFHPGGSTQPYRVGEATAFTTFVPSDDIYLFASGIGGVDVLLVSSLIILM